MRVLAPFVLIAAVLCGLCWYMLREADPAQALGKPAGRAGRSAVPDSVLLEPARADAEVRIQREDEPAPATVAPEPAAATENEPAVEPGPPPGPIPVVIRTRDGRSFTALAEDRGVEPKNLFVHAFRVAASRDAFPERAPVPPAENELARFHPPPGYQEVELPGSVAGTLELLASPPFWVGLWIHGVFFEGRVLQAHDTEIVFVIDADVLDASLATVTARLVDTDSGAAVIDASATLKADTSAHRRADLSQVAPDGQGRLVFRRVMPGQHDLSILREGNIVQRRLELAPAQKLDLGKIEVRSGPALKVRVVDAAGAGVQSWIEIAPLKAGEFARELYPPNLHRQTDGAGVYLLPVPDRVSVVRARPIPAGSWREHAEVGTRNVRIDPDALPPELMLLAQEPVHLRVEPLTAWIAGQRLTFEDAGGLTVDQAGGERNGRLDANLVPGPYVVRRWDGEREVGKLDVTVAAGDEVVRSP